MYLSILCRRAIALKTVKALKTERTARRLGDSQNFVYSLNISFLNSNKHQLTNRLTDEAQLRFYTAIFRDEPSFVVSIISQRITALTIVFILPASQSEKFSL